MTVWLVIITSSCYGRAVRQMFSGELTTLGLLFVSVGLGALGILRWRVAVIAALILAVFEGALRKWVLPEFGQWIHFAKDLY